MSPDLINEKHGHSVWTCRACQAEDNLTWWNGVSVAVCRSNPACAAWVSAWMTEQVDAEDAYQAHCEERGYA